MDADTARVLFDSMVLPSVVMLVGLGLLMLIPLIGGPLQPPSPPPPYEPFRADKKLSIMMHLHVVNSDKRSIAMIPILGTYERDKKNFEDI